MTRNVDSVKMTGKTTDRSRPARGKKKFVYISGSGMDGESACMMEKDNPASPQESVPAAHSQGFLKLSLVFILSMNP